MAKEVRNRVKELIARKEREQGGNLTYRDISAETKLSKNTVGKWARNEVDYYDRKVIATFLDYFNCDVADLIVYEEVAAASQP